MVQVTSGRLVMGTFVNIILFHPSRDQAQAAMAGAFEEMDRLIGILSGHEASTPVSHLNRSGALKECAPELSLLLDHSFRVHRLTGGAFDITIKPLLDLYEKSFLETGQPPSRERVADALQSVGIQYVALGDSRVVLQKEGMALTLDGIAKGFIVDRMMDRLREEGIHHALINAGGDIRVNGPQGNGQPWTIAIQDPWKEAGTIDTVELTRGAIATSGNYEVYYDREKVYHHILRPRSGRPAEGMASVSTIAGDAMTADALSTSVFALGANKGLRLMKDLPSIQGLIVTSDGRKWHADWPQKG
jgi:thiamine biosynthesis lipoprotein